MFDSVIQSKQKAKNYYDFWRENVFLVVQPKSSKKKLSLLAGKCPKKKKSALLNGVWVLVKNILSLLAGKIGYNKRK